MKRKSKILCIMFICSVCISSLKGQETIPATGGNTTGSGGSMSYTVGQVIYQTLSGTSGTVAQGVQQPYEISFITGLEEARDIYLICSAYPNPASDFLTLKIENINKENLSFKLLDTNGRLLESKKVTGNEIQISMSSLFPSIYFLKVFYDQKEIKTFKIIKN